MLISILHLLQNALFHTTAVAAMRNNKIIIMKYLFLFNYLFPDAKYRTTI